MRRILLVLALVSLLSVGMGILPVVSATYEYFPTEEYIVQGSRTYGTFPDDIEKIDNPYITYQTEDDAANSYLDVRMNFTDAIQYPYVYQLRIRFKSFDFSTDLTCNPCFSVQVYDGSSWNQRITSLLNASWKEIRYTLSPDEAKVIGGPQIKFLWNDATVGPYELDLDRVILVDYIQELYDRVDDLEDRVTDLERELEELRKQTHPDVIVNKTNLPCAPHDNRGTLEYDTTFVDPYRSIVYDVLTHDSGSDLDFYLVYPTSADEVTVISDWIDIEETAYDRIWINDTAGSGTELLNTTDAVGRFNLQYGYNITVQTSGASSSVRADRTTTVRLVDSFDWGENLDTGVFAVRSKIENELGYDDMENIQVRWGFPVVDSENREVNVNMASVIVEDADNNLVLDRSRHYSLDESAVTLELRWLNVSESRTFRIEFTRESRVETEEYYTIYDTQITTSDVYNDAPYTVNVHHTQSGSASFEGRIIIKFLLTGKYAGKKLDVHTLKIKRSDQSGFSEYSYDSVANELRITDITVDAGNSITFTLYFDWLTEKGVIIGTLIEYPLLIISALLLIGFMGLMWLKDADEKHRWKQYLGIGALVFNFVAIIILIALG